MQHATVVSAAPGRSPAPAWSVVQCPLDPRVEPTLWKAWSKLAREAPPFLRPEFFALEVPLLNGAQPFVVAAFEDGELVGVLPLMRRGRDLEALRSDETTEYDYVGDPKGLEPIWKELAASRDWDTLTLTGVPADSPLTYCLSELALRDMAITATEPSARSPYLTLPGFEDRLPAKLKANLRRWRRKLGDLELERVTRFRHADLADGLRIEEMAWKAAHGASISSRRELHHFYRALTRLSSHRDELSLYFLKHGSERFAFLYALEDRRGLYAMRIGYDPSYAKLGPGHLLVSEVARDAEARGLVELNFMGRDSEWKRRWTHLTHDHVISVTYRPTVRGLALLVGREWVKPRLSDDSLNRARHTREQLARARRHCQRNDLVGHHATTEIVEGKLRRGLGVRSGLLRLVGEAAPPKRRFGVASRYGPGDWVRVLDAERLRATLDADGKLRGLPFLDYQYETCGRVFRVQDRIQRLVDDDGQMRSVGKTVLLEGVTCDAGHGLGCGRHCPMMYREEWLEPAEAPADLVEPELTQFATVRSLAAIEATLDRKRARDGVTFVKEMEPFAGKRLPVLRRIDRVRELGHETRPRAPIYQLDGAVCTGADLGPSGPCERACLLLWHADWLELPF